MLYVQTATIQPRKWQALVPLALSIIIFIAAQKSRTVFLYFVGGFTVLISLLLLWFLQKTKIIIDDQGITMHTKISTREFLWKDIISSHVSQHFNGKRRVSYWNFETAENKKLSFATSQYARADLKTIAEAVVAKCKHAQIDGSVVLMAL